MARRSSACRPTRRIAVQALDAEGKAVQLMRSWFTAMPGENACPASAATSMPRDTAAGRDWRRRAAAAPREITPWHGPARGFDFEREVQPVLDRHCVALPRRPGQATARPARRSDLVPELPRPRISELGIQRLHPQMLADTQGVLRYTPGLRCPHSLSAPRRHRGRREPARCPASITPTPARSSRCSARATRGDARRRGLGPPGHLD